MLLIWTRSKRSRMKKYVCRASPLFFPSLPARCACYAHFCTTLLCFLSPNINSRNIKISVRKREEGSAQQYSPLSVWVKWGRWGSDVSNFLKCELWNFNLYLRSFENHLKAQILKSLDVISAPNPQTSTPSPSSRFIFIFCDNKKRETRKSS